MDINEIIGGMAFGGDAEGEGQAEKPAPFLCNGVASSPLVSGDVDISVSEDSFALTALLGAANVRWADVVGISYADYTVRVQTKTADYALSKLGYDAEPLYAHMLAAYGDKVRQCLFVSGGPLVRARGDVGASAAGAIRGVPVEVYSDAILSLPPDLGAKRVPLRFLTGFNDEDYAISVTVLDGAAAVYSKLGHEHEPVSKAVRDSLKKLRSSALEHISGIDTSLNAERAAALERLMPGGLAAPVDAMNAIAPSFVGALEALIAESRAAETYKVFQGISGKGDICIGFKKNDMGAFGTGPAGGDGGLGAAAAQEAAEGSGEDGDEKPASPYMLWLIAPAPSGSACAIEFAGAESEAAATFVYRFTGTFEGFRLKLGMALEAIAFRREVIRLTDTELAKPEYELYRMADERNEALRFVRSCFAGRAIHRTPESWKKKVVELFS